MTDADALTPADAHPDQDELTAGPLRFRPRARLLWAGLGLAALALAAGVFIAMGDGDAGEVSFGGNLGAVNDPTALSERLAPELADGGGASREGVRCADSESALPESGAELVYSAELEWEGTPAVVLGYRIPDNSLGRVLLVMAADDCRLLVTQSF